MNEIQRAAGLAFFVFAAMWLAVILYYAYRMTRKTRGK